MTDTTTALAGSRLTQFRQSLTARDRRSLGGMFGFIILLHVIGFGVLFGVVVPKHLHLGGDHPVFTVGVGVLAYTFGLRHAFDADHIAAIDNATRKLLADNTSSTHPRKPLSLGFWFSLGHSTIVFLLTFLLSIGVKALAGQVENGKSGLHSVTGIVGASVSGVFLWILGILNFVVLLGIIKVFREMRRGIYDEKALEEQLNKRGFMNRFLNGLTKSVRKPWHIYPIGVLFGLGFDTATEVGLLVLAGGAAAFNLPWYSILDPADPVRRGHVPDGHGRWRVHERGVRLGVRQAGPQGLLQHHDHGDLGGGRADHRHDRACRCARRPGPHHQRADRGRWKHPAGLRRIRHRRVVLRLVDRRDRDLAVRQHRATLVGGSRTAAPANAIGPAELQ